MEKTTAPGISLATSTPFQETLRGATHREGAGWPLLRTVTWGEVREHPDDFFFDEPGTKVICLLTPRGFQAVGQFYEDFAQVTDDEVIALLGGRPLDLATWQAG